MGKGYNNYMCKKPFHPGSKANIKRAWMAEQKTENEKKKQEELKVQYEKEQELYNNRSLLSTESKDKLELNFMYQAPPGAKKERQKEDDEPEFKFEWQRKYNAPREDYAKGNADIKDQPFGIPVRNVRCIKCHKWGHINTDKECPLFSQASTSSMPTTSMDPMELMKQMREDGYGLKENVLGHHLNPAAANQQLIPSDESDPEMEFLKSLSASEKKKLLRKLKKLSKKQEKASRCKKKKSKKSGRSKSKDKSSDHKKKKSKKSFKSGSSSESGTESSSEESVEEKQKKKKKHSSNRKSKERHSSESSDSELDKPETSKNMKNIQERKDLSKKKHTKSDYLSSQKKVRSISSDNENESKKNKYKNLEHSKSKSATEKKNNSLNNNSESEESERKKVNYFQEEKSGKLAKRFADISSESDQERSFKMSSKHPVYKKSRSPDIITKNHENNRSRGINTEISKNIKTPHTEGSSSEIQEGKSSQRYGEGEKIDNYEKKQNNTDSKLQIAKSNDNYKYDVKLGKHDYESEKNKDQRSNHHISNLKQGDLKRNEENNLNKEKNLKRKTDKGLDSSKQKKRKDDNTNYEEKTKKKNYGECIKTEAKNSYSDSNEELSKRKTDKNETSEVKSKKIDLELVEQKRIDDEEPCTSHYKKKKNISDSDEVEKMYDEQKYLDSSKKVDENKMGEEFSSKEKEYMLPDSSEKHDNVSKILSIKQTCNSPSHPDGFSHLCPQAKVQANYVQVDEEYQGKEHDDFRHFNRERRSPSVKQKYNS